MSNTKEALKAARKGCAWIIRKGHKYDLNLARVNLETLDLEESGICLLSQAKGSRVDYGDVADEITLDLDLSTREGEYWLVEHGFESSDEVPYPDLTDAWKQVITALRTGPEVNASADRQQPETLRETARRLAKAIEHVLMGPGNAGLAGVSNFRAAAAQLSTMQREQLALKVLPVPPGNPEALINAIQAALVNSQHIMGVPPMLRAAEQMNTGTRQDLAHQILAQFNSTQAQVPPASSPQAAEYEINATNLNGLADILLGALRTAQVRQPQLSRLQSLVNSVSQNEWNVLGAEILKRANQLRTNQN